MPEIDAAFTDLPLRKLADAALSRARAMGAEHADIRIERIKDSRLSLHDARLDGTSDGEDIGFAVRVVHDGSWGFASHVDLTPESAERVAEQAVEVAKVSRPLSTQRVELAPEPSYGEVTSAPCSTSRSISSRGGSSSSLSRSAIHGRIVENCCRARP